MAVVSSGIGSVGRPRFWRAIVTAGRPCSAASIASLRLISSMACGVVTGSDMVCGARLARKCLFGPGC